MRRGRFLKLWTIGKWVVKYSVSIYMSAIMCYFLKFYLFLSSVCLRHFRVEHTFRSWQRPFLSVQSAQKLAVAFILSRLDYCNVLLAGVPDDKIARLQRFKTAHPAWSFANQSVILQPPSYGHCIGSPPELEQSIALLVSVTSAFIQAQCPHTSENSFHHTPPRGHCDLRIPAFYRVIQKKCHPQKC